MRRLVVAAAREGEAGIGLLLDRGLACAKQLDRLTDDRRTQEVDYGAFGPCD